MCEKVKSELDDALKGINNDPYPRRLRSSQQNSQLSLVIAALNVRVQKLEDALKSKTRVCFKDAKNRICDWLLDLSTNLVVFEGVSSNQAYQAVCRVLQEAQTSDGCNFELADMLGRVGEGGAADGREAGRSMIKRAFFQRLELAEFHVADTMASLVGGVSSWRDAGGDAPAGGVYRGLALYFDGTSTFNDRKFQNVCVGYEDPETKEFVKVTVTLLEMGLENAIGALSVVEALGNWIEGVKERQLELGVPCRLLLNWNDFVMVGTDNCSEMLGACGGCVALIEVERTKAFQDENFATDRPCYGDFVVLIPVKCGLHIAAIILSNLSAIWRDYDDDFAATLQKQLAEMMECEDEGQGDIGNDGGGSKWKEGGAGGKSGSECKMMTLLRWIWKGAHSYPAFQAFLNRDGATGAWHRVQMSRWCSVGMCGMFVLQRLPIFEGWVSGKFHLPPACTRAQLTNLFEAMFSTTTTTAADSEAADGSETRTTKLDTRLLIQMMLMCHLYKHGDSEDTPDRGFISRLMVASKLDRDGFRAEASEIYKSLEGLREDSDAGRERRLKYFREVVVPWTIGVTDDFWRKTDDERDSRKRKDGNEHGTEHLTEGWLKPRCDALAQDNDALDMVDNLVCGVIQAVEQVIEKHCNVLADGDDAEGVEPLQAIHKNINADCSNVWCERAFAKMKHWMDMSSNNECISVMRSKLLIWQFGDKTSICKNELPSSITSDLRKRGLDSAQAAARRLDFQHTALDKSHAALELKRTNDEKAAARRREELRKAKEVQVGATLWKDPDADGLVDLDVKEGSFYATQQMPPGQLLSLEVLSKGTSSAILDQFFRSAVVGSARNGVTTSFLDAQILLFNERHHRPSKGRTRELQQACEKHLRDHDQDDEVALFPDATVRIKATSGMDRAAKFRLVLGLVLATGGDLEEGTGSATNDLPIATVVACVSAARVMLVEPDQRKFDALCEDVAKCSQDRDQLVSNAAKAKKTAARNAVKAQRADEKAKSSKEGKGIGKVKGKGKRSKALQLSSDDSSDSDSEPPTVSKKAREIDATHAKNATQSSTQYVLVVDPEDHEGEARLFARKKGSGTRGIELRVKSKIGPCEVEQAFVLDDRDTDLVPRKSKSLKLDLVHDVQVEEWHLSVRLGLSKGSKTFQYVVVPSLGASIEAARAKMNASRNPT